MSDERLLNDVIVVLMIIIIVMLSRSIFVSIVCVILEECWSFIMYIVIVGMMFLISIVRKKF